MRLKRQESKYMQQFNIDRYFHLLRIKGYEVKPRYDKQRKLVDYTVGKNASVFKASEQSLNLNLHKRHSQSTLAMKSKRCGYRTLSKMSLLMRFRFQRIMILRQQRMSLM